jgi:hypothetical protein
MQAITVQLSADFYTITGGSSMDSVHDLLAATLRELGLPAPANFIQTVLMKDGYFVGHKLRYDGGYAIMRAGGVEIFDEEGKLLRATNLKLTDEKAA